MRELHRPFTVRTVGASVQVDPQGKTGVGFAVRLRNSESVDVAVTEGTVRLAPESRIIDAVLGRQAFPRYSLEAGELASIRAESVNVARVGVKELNRRLSWTQGLLSFQGETLSEVTDEFNRYNRKHLIVIDPSISNRRIGGAFQATDPDGFVSALQKDFGVRADERVPTGSKEHVIQLSRATEHRALDTKDRGGPIPP